MVLVLLPHAGMTAIAATMATAARRMVILMLEVPIVWPTDECLVLLIPIVSCRFS